MEKLTDVKDGIKVREVIKKGRTTISVIDGENEIKLSGMETSDYFWNLWLSDDNYIVNYSRGCMFNQIPLTIEAAYSIKNHRLLNVKDQKVSDLLNFMLVCSKGFKLEEILTELNDKDLDIIDEKDKGRLHEYLTAGNKAITKDQIKLHLIGACPKLAQYMDLGEHLSVRRFKQIGDDFDGNVLFLHAMPQDLEFLQSGQSTLASEGPTDYRTIYVSEQEQQLRLINRKRKKNAE